MSAQLKKIKLYLSSDLNFFDFLLDGSYFLSELASVSLDAIKTGGFDGVDLFDIADDGTLAFADGINFESTDLEDGKYVIQVKGDDDKEILQMEFINAGATLLSLDNIDTLTALSDDWDGEQLFLTNIDPNLTIESIQVNDDRFQVICDNQSGECLLELKAGKQVQDFGNLELTFTVITNNGVFADTLTLEVQIDVVSYIEGEPDSLNGAGQDGYIEGATVWADNDGNGQLDAGEASDTTDILGGFSLSGNTTGTFHLTGGTDVATLLAFEGQMLAPEGATVISPVTSLIVFVAEEGSTDTATAEAQIKSAFGLDASINLAFFDPISALAEATTAAEIFAASNIFSVGSTILNTATIAGKLLEGSSVSITFRQAEEAVYVALANLILGGGTVSLTDSVTVETIIQNAAVALGFTGTELTNLDSTDAATVISDVNTVIDTATPDSAADVQTALDNSEDVGEAVLVETTKASTTAQGEVADAVSDGDVDTQDLDDYSLEGSDGPGGVDGGLQTEIDSATVGDVDGARGTEGADFLLGSDIANDELSGLGGDDTIQGLGGNDILEGGDGNDELRGGDGADTLTGDAGADTLEGGDGVDALNYNAETGGGGISVDLGAGTATDTWGHIDTLVDLFELVFGSDNNDTIIGTGASDLLLAGRAGDDTLSGGAGDDGLRGDAGADSIDGGADTDTVRYDTFDPAGVIVNLSSSALSLDLDDDVGTPDTVVAAGTALDGWGDTDTLTSIENVWGSNFDDILVGSAEANVLVGLNGDDAFVGGDGADTIVGGGGGIDTGIDLVSYIFDPAGVTVNLATNSATDGYGQVDALFGIEEIQGSNFADSLTGDDLANRIEGMDGNDTLIGGDGNDELQGGDGADTLTGDAGADTLEGGAGNDALNYNAETGGGGISVDLGAGTATDTWGHNDTLIDLFELVFGSDNNDIIVGSGASDLLLAGRGGDDTLSGGAGNDGLRGDAGADSIDGGADVDTVRYNTFDPAGVIVNLSSSALSLDLDDDVGTPDTVVAAGTALDGWGDTDTLTSIENVWGSNFDDILVGSAEANVLVGLNGDDAFVGGDGADTIVGGGGGIDTGIDLVSYIFDPAGVTVNLATNSATDGYGQVDALFGIEEIQGSNFADSLTGDDLANRIEGMDGNDTLIGGDGNDELQGGDGADTLTGDAGADTLEGGDGVDALNYNAETGGGGIAVDLGAGTATDTWGHNDTLIDLFELVFGSDNNDIIVGSGASDLLLAGRGGDDTLSGGAGNDGLRGDAGADSIDGGADVDTVRYNTFDPAGVIVNLSSSALSLDLDDDVGTPDTVVAAGTALDGWGDTDTLTSIENVWGSNFDDILVGSAEANVLVGLNGDDAFVGGDGADTIFGGGGGIDTGIDLVSYIFDSAGVTVNLAANSATDGYGQVDALFGIEEIQGSNFADSLTGDDLANRLEGMDGNDTLIGGDGNDTLSGGDGADTFILGLLDGDNTIVDFTYLQDKLSLQSGIVIASLTLVDADSDGSVDDTLVSFDDGLGNSVGTSVSLIGVDLTGLTDPYLDLLV